MAEKNDTFERFKKALSDKDAQFSDSLIASLLRLIQHMRPKNGKAVDESTTKSLDTIVQKADIKAAFPGLSIPNDFSIRHILDEEVEAKDEDVKVASNILGELEALKNKIQETDRVKHRRDSKSRSRSRSRDMRDYRRRSRDRDDRRGSPDRGRDRDSSRNERDRGDRGRDRDGGSRKSKFVELPMEPKVGDVSYR